MIARSKPRIGIEVMVTKYQRKWGQPKSLLANMKENSGQGNLLHFLRALQLHEDVEQNSWWSSISFFKRNMEHTYLRHACNML